MARPGRPERNRAAGSFRQLRRFHHVINSDKVFGTHRDAAVVLHLTAVFFPLAIGSVLLGVIQVYTRMGIQRRWRAWLTSSVISRWLKNGRYYQLNLVGGDHQNPEYRIAEDLRVATDAPIDFATRVTSAFLSATTFIILLWTIGGALTLTIAGATVAIPGFLVV